ncbi:scramblase-related [Euphorbia peplus]|nr:scramblase-related [Euphorbia peplus]
MNRVRRFRLFSNVKQTLGCNFRSPSYNNCQHSTIPDRGFHCLQHSHKGGLFALSRGFSHHVENQNQNVPHLTRNFLAQLWVADHKLEASRKKTRQKKGLSDSTANRYPSFQPPPSQSISGALKPASPEEVLVAPLLARSNLLITRDIEWANLVLGFEQENRYLVVDVCYPQAPVGFIREKSNLLARQLLRSRRPFVARITDAVGDVLFTVRRPYFWLTSSIYAEIDGKEVGVVHRRWHLWRRIYDLYLGNKQFAVVENPGLWNWTFTLKDINGEVVAQIDRDWRGFGFELFTDAGQYVIRFGSSDPSLKSGHAAGIDELKIGRPLTLSERAVAVALAISLDNDYFSRHSGGLGVPFLAVED